MNDDSARGRRAAGSAERLLASTTLALLTLISFGSAPDSRLEAAQETQTGSSRPAAAPMPPLLAAVRDNLLRERKLLLEYTYREKRRPMRVTPFGKVVLGDEQTLEVTPSSDPDRPQRKLIAVNGKTLTDAERAEYARRGRQRTESPAEAQQRQRRNAKARAEAQERFEDVFRVYRFQATGTDVINGVRTTVVTIEPAANADPRTDVGEWMTKFRGKAWVEEPTAQLARLEMTATETISIGWGFVGRIAEGTTITYLRRAIDDGLWFPQRARFEARGRTLLFRSFDIDTTTEWFDYRRIAPETADAATSLR